MTTFFTSDLHFGHRNIIDYCNRPFADVDDMNATLIRNWNEIVGPYDVVWVLGDVAMGKIADTLPLVSQLNGFKMLIPGNHDRCWYAHGSKNVDKWLPKYEAVGFTVFNERQKYYVNERTGFFAMMSHFPYEGDSQYEGDRYTSERPDDTGHVLLHGHVHDTWQVNGRQINVGCDVWDYRPVSIDTINALI